MTKTTTKVGPLSLRLPDGKPYRLNSLLTDGDSNFKLAKSNGKTKYRTFGLSLAPATVSGYQMCPGSTPGCRAECLYQQGRGVFSNVQAARIARTVAFMEHRSWFEDRLRADLSSANSSSKKQGLTPAIRLNVLSDVQWEKVFPWVFEDYPNAVYYDYSKLHARMMKFCIGELPPNYHLTFSRSELNEEKCWEVLHAGGNVTVVFRTADLPSRWWGFEVVDGDETDLRFLDKRPCVVGLKAKGSARHDATGFVVDTNRHSLPTLCF